MRRVIVTVKRKDEARVRDLEVPADVESTQLAEAIAHALSWESDPMGQPIKYEIEAHSPGQRGRRLMEHESLASAGVWDGSWLVFHPVSGAPSASGASPSPLAQSSSSAEMKVTWQRVELPDADQETTEKPSNVSSGYVWKQVD